MINKTINFKTSAAQALLFVLLAISIALTIGVAVLSRVLSSSQRISRTDTASRVYAAAEGGAELVMSQDLTFLKKLGSNDSSVDCGLLKSGATQMNVNGDIKCKVPYRSQGDVVSGYSVVDSVAFNYNSPDGAEQHYWFTLEAGDVREVVLSDDGGNYCDEDSNCPFEICWSLDNSPIIYQAYTDTGFIQYGAFKASNCPSEVCPISVVPDPFFEQVSKLSSPRDGFNYCTGVTLEPDSAAGGRYFNIRLRALNANAKNKIGIYPASGRTLPRQGYLVTSDGYLVLNNTSEPIVKRLKVYKSLPRLSGAFDFAIYSDEALAK